MAKIENWRSHEFVTADEYSFYCNHSAAWAEKNYFRYQHLPQDEKCLMCCKPLKGKFKILYALVEFDDLEGRGSSTRYYNEPAPNRHPIKIGITCAKAFEKAHQQQYGY